MTRLGALVLGALVGALAMWGIVWVFLLSAMAAQRPDPDVPDGDPCCGVPDTWGEVAELTAAGAASALVVGLLLALAVNLISWAVTARWLRTERLALIPAIGVTLSVLGVGIAQAIG